MQYSVKHLYEKFFNNISMFKKEEEEEDVVLWKKKCRNVSFLDKSFNIKRVTEFINYLGYLYMIHKPGWNIIYSVLYFCYKPFLFI